jgi:hypothetical protein
MPKKATGAPRGRPPKVKLENRLVADAIALGVRYAMPHFSDSDAARLANRLAGSQADFSISRKNIGIQLLIDWNPRVGTISSADRYTQQRLSGTNANAKKKKSRESNETKKSIQHASAVAALLDANSRALAQGIATQLSAWGWDHSVLERLLDFALLNNISNPNYLSIAAVPNKK